MTDNQVNFNNIVDQYVDEALAIVNDMNNIITNFAQKIEERYAIAKKIKNEIPDIGKHEKELPGELYIDNNNIDIEEQF